MTIPILKGIRWRYCTRWDEQPAALLVKSLLRLGICELRDWSGSAVDFVERGFKRFCRNNGAEHSSRVWQGDLRIMDHEFDLTEGERQLVVAEMDEPPQLLYLVGDYSAAASVPIGPTWPFLGREHELLPAAFYRVLVDNLWTWMRVYDYRAALDHAEMWMDGMDEEELKESFYPNIQKNIPGCLRRAEKLTYSKALRILENLQPKVRGSLARQLVSDVLEMHKCGKGYDHAWPGKLAEQVLPLQEFLNDADGCGPGCVITWYEDDEISACFDEEMSSLGQNGPIEPSIMLMLRLDLQGTSMRKSSTSSTTPVPFCGPSHRAPRQSRSSGRSTMNTSVNIGSSQEFRLSRALLVYGKSSYDGFPYRHPFITMYEVIHEQDGAGSLRVIW